MSGTELCAGAGSFFGRAGTFMADGHGNITDGLEDLNICTGVETLQFTSGTYSIGSDGRGALNLTKQQRHDDLQHRAFFSDARVHRANRCGHDGQRIVSEAEHWSVYECGDRWRL
jgi:hypothetical protein